MSGDSDVVLPELSDVFDDPHEAPTAVGTPAYRPRAMIQKATNERVTTPAPAAALPKLPTLPKSPRVPSEMLRSAPERSKSGDFLDALPIPKPRPSLVELERRREEEQQRHLAVTSPGTLSIDGLELDMEVPAPSALKSLDDPFAAPPGPAAEEPSVPPALFGGSDAPDSEPSMGAVLGMGESFDSVPVPDVAEVPRRRPRRRSSLRPSERPAYVSPESRPPTKRRGLEAKHVAMALGALVALAVVVGVGIELSRERIEAPPVAEAVPEVDLALPPRPEPGPLPVEGFQPRDLPEAPALPRAQARRQAAALLEQADAAATHQERLDFLRSAALSDPQNPEIAAELARTHEHEPRLAALWASHAVTLRPNHGGYRLLLGDLQVATGELEAARESFEHARRHGVALAARRLAELDAAP